MKELKELFENNKAWVQERLKIDENYFKNLSKDQEPRFLWIGCSDSRVPANQIVGLEPGELFVHRNVANIFPNTDLNGLSVLEFAVDILKTKHIIVCGHYGCTGVKAAMEDHYLGLVDNWLRNIRDIYFPGHISFEDMISYYKIANIYICMSDHEGFCLPLLESMHFGIPIIAYKSSGIPYTLKDSGIMVSEKRYEDIAEIIDITINDEKFKKDIINKQCERLMDYDIKKLKETIEEIISSLL